MVGFEFEPQSSCLLRAVKHLLSAEIQVSTTPCLNGWCLTNGDHCPALPFSNWLYRMNRYTETPVNSVLFDALFALLLGLLAFAGEQAIDAVFAISVVGLYTAYAIPIAARYLGDNNFKPGPFGLGIFVCPFSAKASRFPIEACCTESTGGYSGRVIHGFLLCCSSVPFHSAD
jgi:hypothetical protein